MKKGTHIIKEAVKIFDSFDFNSEMYEKYCEEEGIEYNENDIDWDYISDCMNEDWDYIKEVLSKLYDGMEVIISGTLGLWNGSPTIENELCDDIEDALARCLSGCSINDWKVSYDNYGVYVSAYHHDGCNSFILSPIKKGTYISEEVLYRFTPKTHKRLIHRVNSIWDINK